MRKKIVCILAAALFAVTLPLTADAKAGIRRGTENVPAESVTVTAEMIRTDANKKNGSSETVPWDPEALRGKTFSILGDSISTYRNTSNRRGSRWSNTTIGRGAAWYSDLKPKLGEDETWWMQLSEDLGLRLLVNNSWAGSGFFRPYRRSEGAYKDRCVQLHDNTGINDGAEPDIIFLFLGTNDFAHFPKTLGTGDLDYDDLFPDNGSGKRTWREPKSTLEAAAVTLFRIRERYPLAEVYMAEMLYRADLNAETEPVWRRFNRDLGEVAEHFGAVMVHFPDDVITYDRRELYYQDNRLHPNALGMDVITETVKAAVLEHTAWKTESFYPVSLELDGVLADLGTGRLVREGQPFSVRLTPAEEGKTVSVSVIAGGEDITDRVWSDGVVSIPAVTCDIMVTAASA